MPGAIGRHGQGPRRHQHRDGGSNKVSPVRHGCAACQLARPGHTRLCQQDLQCWAHGSSGQLPQTDPSDSAHSPRYAAATSVPAPTSPTPASCPPSKLRAGWRDAEACSRLLSSVLAPVSMRTCSSSLIKRGLEGDLALAHEGEVEGDVPGRRGCGWRHDFRGAAVQHLVDQPRAGSRGGRRGSRLATGSSSTNIGPRGPARMR